jgi:all-trans-retinol 13,14-reductase
MARVSGHPFTPESLPDSASNLILSPVSHILYPFRDAEPSEASFYMHAMLALTFRKGAFYPRGGTDQIAKHIIPVITEHGGSALARAPVQQILVEGGRAVGVQMNDGRKIYAKKAVVSDSGLLNTFFHLLPLDLKNRDKLINSLCRKDGKELHNGISGISLFVGLKGDHDKDLNLPHSQLWLHPSEHIEDYLDHLPESLDDALREMKPEDLGPVFVSSPSGKDSTWKTARPGMSTVETMAAAPMRWFQDFAPSPEDRAKVGPGGKPGSKGEKYEQAKERLAQLLWARTREGLLKEGAKDIPENIRDAEFYELGTPLTFAHYLWRDNGAFYGLDRDTKLFTPKLFYERLRPEVPEVPGLYLSGQDVSLVGFVGALVGGYFAAAKILRVMDPFTLPTKVEAYRVAAPGTLDHEAAFKLAAPRA